MDKELRDAIARKQKLNFIYDGMLRIIEPHDYGIHKGAVKVLGFQVGGKSRGDLPGWRLFIVSKMSDLDPIGGPFSGPRPVTGPHIQWDELFASVSRPSFRRAA
jgi:predicted DNA-binding transcriptional regulator YafY